MKTNSRLFLFVASFILYTACGQIKPVRWVSYSTFLSGFFNIKVDLPNVIKQKSAIEFACMGDSECLHIYNTCLINNDTFSANITTTVRVSKFGNKYDGRDTIPKTETRDTSFFGRICNKLIADNKYTKIVTKQINEVQGHLIYILKYIVKNEPRYYINYTNNGYSFKVEIENLKDENVINRIINSISFEESTRFICW